MVTTNRRGLRVPYLVQFLLLLSSFPSTASVTDRHRHNGPSRVFVSKYFNSWNLGTGITSLIFTTDRQSHDGPSQTRRSIEGLRSKILQLLEYGYWDYFSELHDEPAGRTVIDTTDRHKPRNPTLGQIFPSSFSSYTTMPPTDCHGHDEPSQAP